MFKVMHVFLMRKWNLLGCVLTCMLVGECLSGEAISQELSILSCLRVSCRTAALYFFPVCLAYVVSLRPAWSTRDSVLERGPRFGFQHPNVSSWCPLLAPLAIAHMCSNIHTGINRCLFHNRVRVGISHCFPHTPHVVGCSFGWVLSRVSMASLPPVCLWYWSSELSVMTETPLQGQDGVCTHVNEAVVLWIQFG